MKLSIPSRRWLLPAPPRLWKTRHYSTSPSTEPSSARSRSALPWVAGGLAGVAAIGGAGYAWYYLSGAKRIVDTARAGKQRYDETKAGIAEKREQAAVMSTAAKEKAKNLADRLKQRHRATKASKEQDADSEGAVGETQEDHPPS